jgi:hypothetical protein
MERALKFIFIILASLPALFIILAFTFYSRSGTGTLPDGSYVFLDPSSFEGRIGLLMFRTGKVLLKLIPSCFIIIFLCSLLSYFLWRQYLPKKHFNLQSICYLPYLVMVILMHVPNGNPVIWFISYLVNET